MTRHGWSLFLLPAVFTFAISIAQAESADLDVKVPEITVVGETSEPSLLDFVPATGVLTGTKLEKRKASTLGETLGQEAGVSSSYFGPNASRPVVRGLGGERVRVLENGTGVLDASGASEDHAVALDPMALDRIEVVRGPATLLYGNSAIGGAINAVMGRIHETRPEETSGKIESRYSTVDTGAVSALRLDGPMSSHGAYHIDASSRRSSDYRTPALGSVTNSFNGGWNGSLGGSYVGESDFIGGSFSKYASEYGTVAEKSVSIHMHQDRYDFAAGAKNLGWIESLRLKNTYSDYQHQEITNGAVGTTFRNHGDEARLEMKHHKVGAFGGIIGAQGGVSDFEALGDEAFLPVTTNQNYSGFFFEEGSYGPWQPTFGARVEKSEVKSHDSAIFGASETKSFTGASGAVGLAYAFSDTQSLALGLSYAERAPNYQELFANGAHVATGVFEVGDRTLSLERSNAFEISYRHKAERTQSRFGLFLQDFRNFIALMATGATRPNSEGENLPEYRYRAVEARLQGAEVELKHQTPVTGGTLELELKADMVEGRDRTSSNPLPRITPRRGSIGVTYKTSRYSLDGEIQRIDRQSDVAIGETPTDGYTMVNLGAEMPLRFGDFTLDSFVRVNNAFDVDARNHVSLLKNTAPLPGRNLILGVQALF